MPGVGQLPRLPVLDEPPDDSMAIKFKIEHPKRLSSRSCEVYKLYKPRRLVKLVV